ncbi:glycosyltransferase family 2 protein [Rhodococcus sp. KBS0724]|jgi:GT2 family glycosyltransferase|uniref:glycosyltransferase n=1 Tax=Rhodococcus sp. KBS0724 TaxID=1179674 RepID=UPI00110F1AFE|nr:glycosyltransferase family 2 protein [Rhodococcus sp. KBS0724]TSD48394.1 glycosyltransferase family 2 protein [Rhodococcus sp. KBS0724]
MGVQLSVVVPVYNENEYLSDCLESLLRQGDDIFEIVVVDNNSTDGTVEIIKEFERRSSKIRYLVETRQGVVFARDLGFNAAQGELIGRVDADTRVLPGWAREIHELFTDTEFDAVTGFSLFYESPFATAQRKAVAKQDSLGNLGGLKDAPSLTGSNMAIRKSAWLAVQGSVSDRKDFHEDVDLSYCLLGHGMKIVQNLAMRAEVSGRRGETGPIEFLSYNKASIATLKHHGAMNRRLRFMIFRSSILHAVLWPAYRMYDKSADTMSVKRLFFRPAARQMPVEASGS